MEGLFLYLFVGFLFCSLGAIPFGPIDLAVVKTTVDYDRRSGIEIVFAASIIETQQVLIATCFSMLISFSPDVNFLFAFILVFIFIALAIFIFSHKATPIFGKEKNRPALFFSKRLDYCWTEFSGRTILDLRGSDNKSVLPV